MTRTESDQLHSPAEIEIIPCSRCRRPMRLAHVEPVAPGWDIRSFECWECDTVRSISAAI